MRPGNKVALDTIARILRRNQAYQAQVRVEQCLMTDDSTRIIVSDWPNGMHRGQVDNWIKAIEDARDQLPE